jgi:RNA polymerase sigma-70 factor (ECF subfamily)
MLIRGSSLAGAICFAAPDGDGSLPAHRGWMASPECERAALPAEWFRDHVAALWRLVRRLGVPAGNIEDVVQETFIIACRRSADIGAGQARAFLFGTAVRIASNHRQRAHRRHEVAHADGFESQASPYPDAEQILIAKRWRERLERALGELSDPHREVFVLFELEGFSVPEIAELLEVPLGTVSSRLQRARARFSEAAVALKLAADTECP